MHANEHPQPDARALDRGCEYCGERMQYVGTDHDSDGDYVSEYWCDNCKEYLYYVVEEHAHTSPATDGAGAGE